MRLYEFLKVMPFVLMMAAIKSGKKFQKTKKKERKVKNGRKKRK